MWTRRGELWAKRHNYTLDEVDTDSAIGSFMNDIAQFFVDQEMIDPNDLPNVEASVDHSFLDNVKTWSGK